MPPGRDLTVVAHEVHQRGGMERAQWHVIRALLAAGWRVTVICRRAELPTHPGLTVHRVRVPSRPFAVEFPLFWLIGGVLTRRRGRGLVTTIGANVPNAIDVATIQFVHAAFGAQITARAKRGTPLHRINDCVGSRLSLAAERISFRPSRTRAYIAVSPRLADELAAAYAIPRSAIKVIPNGVDPAAFKPDRRAREEVRRELGLADEARLAIFVGGDWERKGLSIAMAAAAQSGFELLVVGAGDRARYSEQAHALGLQAHFVGARDDVERCYAASDVFMLPSSYEGFALVTIEAAACGLPLLVTAATGADRMVEDYGAGHVLEREVGAFADALRKLRDPELLSALSKAARRAGEEHSWRHITARYVAEYERMAA